MFSLSNEKDFLENDTPAHVYGSSYVQYILINYSRTELQIATSLAAACNLHFHIILKRLP